jgi:hypothetical protein
VAGASPDLPFGRELRVALVKQSTYSDLYTDPQAPDVASLVRSSWHRTGPIGLFTEFTSRFFIVHPEEDPECRVWEEKQVYWRNNPKREADDRARHAAQDRVAVSAEAVDWSEFDLVIAIENAVPARVTRKHPNVVWATLLEHHRMRDYSSYLSAPPSGYDLFFNLRYGPNPRSFRRRPHVIDWPYNYTRPDVLRTVFGCPQQAAGSRLTVLVEDNQGPEVEAAMVAAGFEVRVGRRATLGDYLDTLLSVDAFVFPSPARPLGGLAMIDAASANVVLAGDRGQLWNPFLLPAESSAGDSAGVAALLRMVAARPEVRTAMLEGQRRRIDWFVGRRPWWQIHAAIAQIERKLSLRAKAISSSSRSASFASLEAAFSQP